MPLRLSDEVEARLQHLGFQNDVTAWEIGDVTEYIFQLITRGDDLIDPQTEEVILPMVVYNTIGKHAQKSPHSIRDYHYTSRHIPLFVRQEYPLGRHHWKALIPHCETVKDLRRWAEKILEWADDYGGQIISVAALRMKLAAGGNGDEKKWAKSYRLARKHCDALHNDEEAPRHIRDASENFLKSAVPLP